MAKIIRSRDRSENIDFFFFFFFFAFHDVYETCRAQHISDEVFITLNVNIWHVIQQQISLVSNIS